MEVLKLWRAPSLTTRWGGVGSRGENCVSRRWRSSISLQNAKPWNNSLVKKRKNYNGVIGRKCVTLTLGLLQLQQRETRWKCRSNDDDKSHATAVLDEEIEDRRKELLDRYLVDGFETEVEEEDLDEKDEEDDRERSGERGDKEFFSRCRAIRGAALHTMVTWAEDLVEIQPENKPWTMNLDIRRMLTPRTRGLVLLNILTFLYGSNISILKSAGTTMDPTLFSVGRFAIASMVFTPFLSDSITKKGLRKASVELGFLASAGYLTQCISVLTSDAARVSFISTFTYTWELLGKVNAADREDLLTRDEVIVVPLFAGLSGAKISKVTWFAAAAALVGVGLLESNGAPFAIGDVWSFISAVVFGAHILRTEHHSTKLAPEDSLPVMALQLVVITICSGLWSCASHVISGDLDLHIHASNWSSVWERTVALPWLPMLYTGLLSTAFCLWTELVSMRDVKATEAAVIYTTEPLWGAAFAWVSLGERWGPNGWLGAFFILGGSLTMQLFGNRDAPAPGNVANPPPSLDMAKLNPNVQQELEVNQSERRTEHEDYSAPVQIPAPKALRTSRMHK